jgi:homopolymeric O-antigen transport system permease protein
MNMSQSPISLEERLPGRGVPAVVNSPASIDRADGIADATSRYTAAVEAERIVIEPRRGWLAVDRRELWHHRELLYFLVWRDVKVRYKQTVLGVAWAVLVPVLSMLVFTAIFGNFAGLKDTLPEGLQSAYPVYVYAGLLPWLFFSNAISLGGLSLVNQQQLLTKIYFPRLFVPTATVGGALVDMGLSFFVFLGLMAYYGILPSLGVVFLPLLVVWTAIASLGIAYLLSALTVSYHDFKFVIPFTVQIWQFLSPVVYPTSMVPARYRFLFALNPLTGIIDGYRAAMFGVPVSWPILAISVLSTAALFMLGVSYFRQTERRFADIA